MSKIKSHKFYECPNCQKNLLEEIKPHVFRCVPCDYYKDNNSPKLNWAIPAITIGIFSGLIFAGMLSNQIFPNCSNTTTPKDITKENAKDKPATIAKAISGNQVSLELNGKVQKVILCGLNSPVSNSNLFSVAKQNLQTLLDKTGGDNLVLTTIENSGIMPIVELYDRRENISLNAQQAASGYATSSLFLAETCRDREQILAKVKEAEAQHKGIWELF